MRENTAAGNNTPHLFHLPIMLSLPSFRFVRQNIPALFVKVHLLKHTATVKEVLPTLSLMVLIPLSFTIREDISALSAVKCSLKKIPLQCPAEEFQSLVRGSKVDYIISATPELDEYLSGTTMYVLGQTENYRVWKVV